MANGFACYPIKKAAWPDGFLGGAAVLFGLTKIPAAYPWNISIPDALLSEPLLLEIRDFPTSVQVR